MRVTFELGELSPTILAALLASLLEIDMAFLREHPETPPLYASGVRYRKSRAFRDIPSTIRARFGSCEDLAPWRCAELRNEGEDAGIPERRLPLLNIQWTEARRGKRRRFHVRVAHLDRRGDVASYEDPSVVLGMAAP